MAFALAKLKRALFGGSHEALTSSRPPHIEAERATPSLPTSSLAASPRPGSNRFPKPWVGPRPSSSPADCGERQNTRSNCTAAGSRALSPSQAPLPPPAPKSTQTINVILFGEAGVGKSAVVNLIAQRTVTKVSPDARGCTLRYTSQDVNVDGKTYRIFDTVGLNQASEVSGVPVNAHLEAIENAYKLICALRAAGGVHLLLFCMRGGARVTRMTENNYRLFAEFLCQRRVPVAVVATHLEWEERMEDWWTRNEGVLVGEYGIESVGHACVTTLCDGNGPEDESVKYAESKTKIRDVLRDCPQTNGFLLETTDGVAKAAKALRILANDKKQPSSKDIKKRLSEHLKLCNEDVEKILKMMNEGT